MKENRSTEIYDPIRGTFKGYYFSDLRLNLVFKDQLTANNVIPASDPFAHGATTLIYWHEDRLIVVPINSVDEIEVII